MSLTVTPPRQTTFTILYAVGKASADGKIDADTRDKMAAGIQVGVDLSMQVNAIDKCAPGNSYQLQTLASLALKKIPEATADTPVMSTPPRQTRTGVKAAKPAGLSIGTSDPFDQWWDKAGQVMSPVKRAPDDGAHAKADHEDTDDEAEEIDSDVEEHGASLSSKGGIADTTRRGKSFRTNAALADDDFFAERGTPKPARRADIAEVKKDWDPNADWFGDDASSSGASRSAAPEDAPFGGASASTTAQDGAADVSVKAVKNADAKPSTVRLPSATAVEEEHKDECEGLLYMRVSGALFSHQWRPRYVVLHKGVVHVYRDRYSRIHYPEEKLEEVHLSESMALSGMKVAAASGTHPRVFYRHIAALESGGLFGENQQADQNQPGQRRVFKYGADSPDEFENWSSSFKAAIDRLRRRKSREQQDQLELEGAISSSDAFAEAIRSPRSRPHRRGTGMKNQLKEILGMHRVEGEQLTGTTDVTLHISLLDGTKFNILVHAGGTVRDALVSLRERLGLTSDADFSLFLRDKTGGREHFTVIPDISTAEEAESTAARDARDLVYMRRIFLPPLDEEKEAGGVGAAAAASAEGGPKMVRADSKGVVPIDVEAANATDKDNAAHRLLYVESVYHVTKGNYMVTPQGAVLLAALQCISHPSIGQYVDSKHADGSAYTRHVQDLFSASTMAEWVHTHEKSASGKEGVPGLLDALKDAHKATAGKGQLAAQKEYVQKLSDVEEYGSTFFHATLLRHPAETGFAHGSKSVPDTPKWARDVTTTEHARDTDIERLPVLVAMNYKGIWTRPAPVYHVAGENFARYTGELASLGGVSQAGGSGNNTTAALQRMNTLADGKVVPWALHQVQYIEVWGVKKLRPVFTYRVRERQLTVVEVQSPQYKECASVLHAYVFALLARKEGKSRDNARSNALDYGASALAAKAALKAAKSQAGIQRDGNGSLPPNWSEIRDPVTGSTAYWNSQTKQTVWAKPTE